MAYYTALQTAGDIESWEVVQLTPHGGDLIGFVLLRGDPEKLMRLARAPELVRLLTRAGTCLDHVGVVPAYVDAGVMQFIGEWGGMIADLI